MDPTSSSGSDLNRIIQRFESAWATAGPPQIEDYLPAAATQSDFRLQVLRALVLCDLGLRFQSGELVRAESYLDQFKELASDDDAALELIAREHELRTEHDCAGTLAEYAERFPTFCEQLPERLTLRLQTTDAGRQRRMRLNCPHCHAAIVVVATSGDASAECSACRSKIELALPTETRWPPDQLPQLDQFQLLKVVGRGAFGTVYRARDTNLDRIVAVKIPRGRFISEDEEDRFAREARSVAQLNHPGIVNIYEVGLSDDVPYIVAEFVDGVTLDDVLRDRRFNFRDTADVLANLADALQHAHDRGVVHRDIKPSNVMLQAQDDHAETSDMSSKSSWRTTQSNVARPRLMDFGLARRDGSDVTVTLEGQVLGTPAYMSPEQARGDTSRIDSRSDVYSLGVILYEMLSGAPPFRGTLRVLLHQVAHEEPAPPRKFNSHIPRELDTVCLKCLEKDPDKRYQSAKAFADELRRFMNGEPILARPLSWLEKRWRWCRRNPSITLLSAALAVALTAGVVGITNQWLRAEASARQATQLAAQESTARSDAEREAATLAEVNLFLNDVLGSANPSNLGRKVTVREAVDAAADRIEEGFKDPRVEAAVRKTIGDTYRSLSELDKAEQQLRRAVELYRSVEHTGHDPLESFSALNKLAGTLRSRKLPGDLKEAESIRRNILEVRERIQGPHHADTLAAIGNLANVLSTQRRDREAIKLYERSLKGSLQLFGRHSEEAIIDRYNLASSLADVGEFDQASSELRTLQQLVRDAPNDPRTLNIDNMLAGSLHAQGKTVEAVALYRSTLERRDEVLGPQHLHTLSTFRRLTRLLVEVRKFEAALPLLRECLGRHDKRFGPAAGLTFGVRKSLAATLQGLERIDDAEKFLLATRETLAKKRGIDHKYTREAEQALVRFYESRGEGEKSAKFKRK